MGSNIRIWLRDRYQRIVNSIAIYPVFIATVFLLLAFGMIWFDFSPLGQQIKSQLHWLSLKDATTARSIISAIASGIISLAVFSFSMVMIVLNQAASQMSNRVLDKLIGNRFQQLVLGIYIGTIVYALFLLSTIRDIDSGVYIPALSTYLLIFITILDIFLFIYFLHYITQSVKYEVIIRRIFRQTNAALERSCRLKAAPPTPTAPAFPHPVLTNVSGIYTGFNQTVLLGLCQEHDCQLSLLHPPGTFLLKGLPVMQVDQPLDESVQDRLLKALYIGSVESIDDNFFYGIRQLMEVAIKALSPGINDPGTATESLRAIFQLLAYRACYFPNNTFRDAGGQIRIFTRELSFEQIFSETVLPIWDYGKKDRMIQQELQHLLAQLQAVAPNPMLAKISRELKNEMQKLLMGSA